MRKDIAIHHGFNPRSAPGNFDKTLRDAGFTVSVDYIRNDPTLQADTVILQSPAAGTALEAGDCITLTVARAVPDPFRQVPSLLGMSVAEARRRLAIVELLPTLTPSNLTEGTITAQDPLPGTLLHRNAHVRLVAK